MRRIWKIAAGAAALLFVAGLVSFSMSGGPGKGGNLGAALLGLLLWFLAVGAGLVAIVTAILAARQRRRMPPQRGFDVTVSNDPQPPAWRKTQM